MVFLFRKEVKNMKKLAILVAALALVVIAVPAFAKSDNAKGPAPKVDVCHFEGNGSYHLINVSENAVSAHLEHGDLLAGTVNEPVPGMEEGYYYIDTCEYEFRRSAEITSPETEGEYNVGDEVIFAATLWDKDKDDSVQWAVRKGTCVAGQGTVYGNVDGYSDDYDWDGMYFSSTADTTGWDGGDYCFVFNPTESVGDTAIRELLEFTLTPLVCEPTVVPDGNSYSGRYGGTVTPVVITNEDCSTTYALKTETAQNFSQGQPSGVSAGWAGWSCVEVGYPHVVGGGVVPEDGTVIAQGPAEYEAPAIDGYNYPVYPHYTYNGGANAPGGEEGWVVEAAGPTPPTGIYVLCGE